MRKATVRYGLKLILTGILAVTAATFYHAEIAALFFWGGIGEAQITLLGFFIGGLAGGCGVLIAAGGFLQSGADEKPVRLGPLFFVLLLAASLFFYLAYRSITHPGPPRVPPGESITI
jgi:hypothetical protein